MNPDLQVRHIFNYSFFGSLKNALRKSFYWTLYSLRNRDLLSDSGTASIELKTNVVIYFLNILLIFIAYLSGNPLPLGLIPLGVMLNLLMNWGLFRAMYQTGRLTFTIAAALYYVMVYPLAVGIGAFAGVLRYLASQLFRAGGASFLEVFKRNDNSGTPAFLGHAPYLDRGPWF